MRVFILYRLFSETWLGPPQTPNQPKVPPRANAPPRQLEIDYSDSQIVLCEEPFDANPIIR